MNFQTSDAMVDAAIECCSVIYHHGHPKPGDINRIRAKYEIPMELMDSVISEAWMIIRAAFINEVGLRKEAGEKTNEASPYLAGIYIRSVQQNYAKPAFMPESSE